jgi:hypothetical protein
MSEDLGSNLDTEVEAPRKRGARATVKTDRVRILLEESDEIPPTGLFVGLNGRGFLLRPGEELDVPAGVKEILDHAVMLRPIKDPQTQQVVGYREQMRYPYRMLG